MHRYKLKITNSKSEWQGTKIIASMEMLVLTIIEETNMGNYCQVEIVNVG